MEKNHKPGKKTDLEIIEDFANHFCVICRKRIMVGCGTPVIHIGGCCVGIVHKKQNTIYARVLNSHFHCYINAKDESRQKKLIVKDELKLMWKFEDVKEIIQEK